MNKEWRRNRLQAPTMLCEHHEADRALLVVLRTPLGTRDDMEIRREHR